MSELFDHVCSDTIQPLLRNKAELIVYTSGNQTIHIGLKHRLNWFQRLMYKICFGIVAKNIEEERKYELS